MEHDKWQQVKILKIRITIRPWRWQRAVADISAEYK